MRAAFNTFQCFVVRVGENRVSVYRDEDGGLFVHTYGLSTAFGFATANGFTSFLSRTKIATVENSDLKNHLRAKGAVRFLDENGIAELLDARLDGEDLAIANADLERAREGTADREIAQEYSADFCGPSASIERDHYKDDEDDKDDENDTPLPPILRRAPIPVRADDHLIVVPRFDLPRGEDWWSDDRYMIGKKFALPEYDHGRTLRSELEQFRTFWAEEDSPSRTGDVWANATLEKRVKSRAC